MIDRELLERRRTIHQVILDVQLPATVEQGDLLFDTHCEGWKSSRPWGIKSMNDE